jgi:hypothetical protein
MQTLTPERVLAAARMLLGREAVPVGAVALA